MVSRSALGRARGGAGAERGGGAPAALCQICRLWRARASAPCPLRFPACAGMPGPLPSVLQGQMCIPLFSCCLQYMHGNSSWALLC